MSVEPEEPQREEHQMPTLGRRTERLNRAVRFYRILLRVSLTILLFLFVKTLLSELPQPALAGLGAYVLLKLSLVIYMYCWFFGCNRDLSVQNDVLRDAPKPTVNEVGIAIVILAGFVFLFYVENPALLSTVFVFFLAANVGGWVYLQRVMRPFAEEARRNYENSRDVVGEVKTLIYQGYMFGTWQWWRFATGFGLLAALTGVAFDVMRLPGIAQDVAFACLTALTISVLEAWIWWRRLKLKVQWDCLDWLNDRGFVVEPSASANVRRAHV